MRAWVLDAGGVPCALDDSPLSRGLKGAVVQLETHAIASIAQTANPLLQVSLSIRVRDSCLARHDDQRHDLSHGY